MLRRVGNLDPTIPDKRMEKYLGAKSEEHGTSGNVDLTYGDDWLPDIEDVYVAAEQSGHRVNPDVNNGDPIGMGMGSVCIAKGIRATSASAYLSQPPSNLKILPNAPVARLIFDGKRAIGVQTIDGRKLLARKEVIVSGGALNTPQILKLSGVGPAEELRKHGIPVVLDSPMVGENLQDHCFSAAGIVMGKDPKALAGPGSQSPTPMGWLKLPNVTSSSEFRELPARIQKHMHKQTVPAMEIATASTLSIQESVRYANFTQHTPASFFDYEPTDSQTVFGGICLIMNPQSRGTVTLRSSNPSDSPLIDPKFLTHQFDRRVLIEGMREMIRIFSAPVYASRTLQKLGPKDDSDDSIWDHIRSNLRSSWHMSGTACMGLSAKEAVVDDRFNIFGLKGCRVVDLSVCPFVINAHTQSTAYVLGEIAAEVIAEEYGLGEVTISGKMEQGFKGKL
jgi:choline dehydrogenase-like flavoprotein